MDLDVNILVVVVVVFNRVVETVVTSIEAVDRIAMKIVDRIAVKIVDRIETVGQEIVEIATSLDVLTRTIVVVKIETLDVNPMIEALTAWMMIVGVVSAATMRISR